MIDLVFVVDNSGSIRDNNVEGQPDNYEQIQEFIVSIIEELTIGSEATLVGLVRFSDDAKHEFFLNTFPDDKQALISAVRAIGYDRSNTNTAAGIRAMDDVQFSSTNGDRPNVQNVAIIITDGVSTVDTLDTIPAAEDARDNGIRIFSVGITNATNEAELRLMSSPPHQENVNWFSATDFSTLNMVTEELVEQTCTDPSKA